MKKRTWIWGGLTVIVAAIIVIVLWPAPDPLAGVETVAVRVGNEPAPSGGVDFESGLRFALGNRHIRIVPDEASADVVLSLTDLSVKLGNVEISLADRDITVRASAECRLTDVRTGQRYVMDLRIRYENQITTAELVGRKFWQFWK